MSVLSADERLWSHNETAEYLNISKSQLYSLNSTGDGPPSLKIGGLRRYDPDSVREWVRKRVAPSRAVTA